MRVKTYDFRSFCSGELVRVKMNPHRYEVIAASVGGAVGLVFATIQAQGKTMVETAVPALAQSGHAVTATVPVSIDHAFDPVIAMLQQIAFPVASIVLAWACLQAMVGKPAAAVDRAKWAVLGYLAMRYAPEILRHV
jgi:hypothetical protein